jgi:hypothetical protein
MNRVFSTNLEKSNAYKILVEKPEGNRSLERPRPRWNLERQGGVLRTGLMWLRIGTTGGLL